MGSVPSRFRPLVKPAAAKNPATPTRITATMANPDFVSNESPRQKERFTENPVL